MKILKSKKNKRIVMIQFTIAKQLTLYGSKY